MDTQTTPQPNGAGDHDMVEEVRADVVEISQGGAGLIQAESVSINQGGAQVVETKNLEINQGGIMAVTAETVELESSAAAIINADTVQLNSSSAALAITDTLQVEDTGRIGVLLAGTIEGNPRVGIDARAAAVIGVAAAATLFVLKRLFRRS